MPENDDWGPDTGVVSLPAPGKQPSARAALEKMDSLERKFDDHAELDRSALAEIRSTLKEHGDTLVDLRECAAGTTATLGEVRSELRHVRRLELVKTEASAKRELETGRFQRAKLNARAKIIIALIGLAGLGCGAALKALVGS